MVTGGRVTLKEAGSLMDISCRHAKRLKRKLLSEEARGLVYGNRSRPSPRALDPQLSQRIIEISQKIYAWFNLNPAVKSCIRAELVLARGVFPLKNLTNPRLRIWSHRSTQVNYAAF
jgi:hypothetical protein